MINIDHHVSNPRFGAANLVDPSAAATCEIVALMLPELGITLDTELATCLAAGLVQPTAKSPPELGGLGRSRLWIENIPAVTGDLASVMRAFATRRHLD